MGRPTSSPGDPPSLESIREWIYAFRESRILLTAYELSVFTALGDEARTSREVSASVGTHERATDRLMNALCAMGLLEKREDRFSNSPLAARYLVDGKPEYMAGLMHSVHLWDNWSILTNAVRTGKPAARPEINDRGQEWFAAFIAAMHERASKQADDIVALLDLEGVSRVLDVGGGSGVYAMAFVRAHEAVRATVFDLPNVILLAQRYIEAEGLSDRIETVIGDYTTDDLGSGFDLVFLSAIVHSNSFDANRELIRKCSDSLNPQGQVVVQDFIISEDRTSPPGAALFSLNMLVSTQAGDTYTESEMRTWMEDTGLSDIIRQDTGFGTTQIIGRKPGLNAAFRA